MTGINIWLAKEQKEDTSSLKHEVVLNINLWNDIKCRNTTKNYLDIGIFCDKTYDHIFLSVPSEVSKDEIIDIQEKAMDHPKILNLIFKNNKEYSANSDKNKPFVFSLNKDKDSQFLRIADIMAIQDLGKNNSLIHIPIRDKKKEVERIYVRFRIPLKDKNTFYNTIRQQGLQDTISVIECLDLRINDPRYINSIPSQPITAIQNILEVDKERRNRGRKYLLEPSVLKEVHVITVDPFNKHPLCYDDYYKLTPRILEPEWKGTGYIEYTNKEDLLSHHFRFKPDAAVKSSICFVKFEHKSFGRWNWRLSWAIIIIIVLGIISGVISSYIFSAISPPAQASSVSAEKQKNPVKGENNE